MGVKTKSSREQRGEIKWFRGSATSFFDKDSYDARKQGLRWAATGSISYTNLEIGKYLVIITVTRKHDPTCQKIKRTRKKMKNQTRSRGKHKVCLMLAPPNKEIPLKVFEKKSIKAWIQQHRLLKKKPQSNHRVELELRKAQQRNWEAPDSKLVSCFHKTWSDILNWNNP